ncbi:MAG: PHP domain-containing protein [Clostridiales bacterium]|nr:PHP domain-containing protein [Clostridiales bacterium]
MIDTDLLGRLNAPDEKSRIENLAATAQSARFPEPEHWCVNNHIHTTYSFSPYSPAAAVYFARAAGLASAGIVDHDSIGGAREFIRAGEILNMPVTIGVELRLSMAESVFESRRTNHPDQVGVSYFVLHGIPEKHIDTVNAFLTPVREHRKARIGQMTVRLNEILSREGIHIDFKQHVLPLSMYDKGGSVTERHLLLAAAYALTKHAGRGEKLISLLGRIGVAGLSEKQLNMLYDTDYYFYEYDLLGILKGYFLERIYIDAADECPGIDAAAELTQKTGSILCYAYLGDVTESVTGDKKALKFEDDYIEELFGFLSEKGVNAIAYMPTRNTAKQLKTVKELCEKYDMLEICGEDINSPRQSFVCEKLKLSEHENLIKSTQLLLNKT